MGTIVPYYRTNPNIPVGYTVSDNYSGVAFVDLWYRYDEANSPWGYSGFRHLSPVTGAGVFNFVATEGTVEFYTIATDNFGNVEAPPASADATACYDVTPPVSEILSTGGTVSYNEVPIPIYYKASDEVSGIDTVYLYYRFNGVGPWMYSWLTATATAAWTRIMSIPNTHPPPYVPAIPLTTGCANRQQCGPHNIPGAGGDETYILYFLYSPTSMP